MAREHVREETNAQRDQAHELAEDLERHDQREQRLRRLRDPALEVAHGPVPADALEVREDEGQQGEGKGHRERGGGGVDAPDGEAVPGLAGERQRDEPEHVDHEDEEEERRDVREPAADRLRGQPLLGDLRLGDLVDLLAERLSRVRLDANAPAHEEDPERHRQHRAEHQVHDRLRDRQVERPDVDRDPLVLLELVRRVELTPSEGVRRRQERDRREDEERAPHSGSFPK